MNPPTEAPAIMPLVRELREGDEDGDGVDVGRSAVTKMVVVVVGGVDGTVGDGESVEDPARRDDEDEDEDMKSKDRECWTRRRADT